MRRQGLDRWHGQEAGGAWRRATRPKTALAATGASGCACAAAAWTPSCKPGAAPGRPPTTGSHAAVARGAGLGRRGRTAVALDRACHPLSDAPFLDASLAHPAGLASDADRLAGVAALLSWWGPGHAGFLDASLAHPAGVASDADRLAGVAALLSWWGPGHAGFHGDLSVAPNLDHGHCPAAGPDCASPHACAKSTRPTTRRPGPRGCLGSGTPSRFTAPAAPDAPQLC